MAVLGDLFGSVAAIVIVLTGSDQAAPITSERAHEPVASVANPAATDRLLEDGELNETWLFIIGDDGTIMARWDNLVIRDEVEEAVKGL